MPAQAGRVLGLACSLRVVPEPARGRPTKEERVQRYIRFTPSIDAKCANWRTPAASILTRGQCGDRCGLVPELRVVHDIIQISDARLRCCGVHFCVLFRCLATFFESRRGC